MIPESVTPEGLRARAEMVRSDSPCDRTSTARHIDLAADEIEQLQAENRKLILAMVRIDYESKCDWCADIAKSVLPDVMPTHVSDAKSPTADGYRVDYSEPSEKAKEVDPEMKAFIERGRRAV